MYVSSFSNFPDEKDLLFYIKEMQQKKKAF